jgi:hypothetical protein
MIGGRLWQLLFRVAMHPSPQGDWYQKDSSAGGGDNYTMLEDLPRVLGFGPSLDAALADYLTATTPTGGSVRSSTDG